jgi:GcrA cell cycle regulator
MEPSNWASSHCDALRDYLSKGMSFAEIGREINSRFGTAYTRSAVIGRARRMGLDAAKRADVSPVVSSWTAAAWPRVPATAGGGMPPLSALAPAPVKLRCVGVSPRLISVLELRPGDCRYPYGGDKEGEEIAFCGHPRRSGSSYCAPHFQLTKDFGTETRRFAGPVVLRLVAAA